MDPAVKPEFEAVRRNRISEEIARQIERMITEKKMKPGDMLPPERQLAESFGVSRSSLRDAIRILELSGLVEARQGFGTVVKERAADAVTPLTAVLVQKRRQVGELLDVRKMIEPPLAARAALHATPEEVAEMEAILRRQQQKMQGGELAIDEDSEFHYAIAMAADNSVVLKVLDVLMDLLRDTRERSLQVTGRPERSIAGHQEILDAIKRQDAPGAEAAMCRHIEAVENIVLTKL